MLDAIISLLIKAFDVIGESRDSRKRFIKQLLLFEKALKDCHTAFLHYVEHPQFFNFNDPENIKQLQTDEIEELEILKENHRKTVVTLTRSLEKVDHIFEIYYPKARNVLAVHVEDEAGWHSSVQKQYFLQYVNNSIVSANSTDYQSALETLHEFIRKHVEPDELF